MATLNQCRMFLNAITVADICSVDGLNLHPKAYAGKRREANLHRYNWPRQPRSLPDTHWNLWKKALETCFLQPYRRASEFRLRQPLQGWLLHPFDTCPWLYNTTTGDLYHREGLLFQRYSSLSIRYTRHSSFTRDTHTDRTSQEERQRPIPILPIGSYEIVDVEMNRRTGCCHIRSSYTSRPPAPAPLPGTAPTLEAAKALLSPDEAWAVEYIYSADNGYHVALEIISGSAIAVSDGSYKNDFGTSAFIMEGIHGKHRITGRNCIPGSPADQSSHRSELGGIVGIATALKLLCQVHDITEGKITIGLDGLSALNSCKSKWDPHCSKVDFDMIWESRKILNSLPIDVAYRWVEGHQDTGRRDPYRDQRPARVLPDNLKFGTERHYGCLDRWAKLNIEADQKAKDYWAEKSHHPVPNRRLSQERLVVRHKGIKQAQFDIKALYKSIMEPIIKKHWQEREARMRDVAIVDPVWDDLWNMIDWKAHGRAFRDIPLGKKRWLTKHASGHCGVGRMLQRWKWQSHSECPRCGQDDESTPHILRCPDIGARAHWRACLHHLTHWMQTNNTCPTLTKWIVIRLNEWRTEATTRKPVDATPAVNQAIRDQDRIGWWSFLLGRLPKSFTLAQEQHFQLTRSRKKATAWTPKLLQQIWDLTFSMWEHRNNALHGTVLTQAKSEELQRLRQKVQDEFSIGKDTLLVPDQWRLKESNREFALSLSILKTQQWLTSVDLSRQAYAAFQATLHKSFSAQKAALRRWLDTANPAQNHGGGAA